MDEGIAKMEKAKQGLSSMLNKGGLQSLVNGVTIMLSARSLNQKVFLLKTRATNGVIFPKHIYF